MSLEAIKEAALSVVHTVPDSGTCLKCRLDAEIAALEKAAKDIGVCRAMPRPTPEARLASIRGFVLLATIAKEAE